MKLLPFLLASCLLMFMACYRNKKEPKQIVIDFRKHGWTLLEGDSIIWEQPEFIEDTARRDTTGTIPFITGKYLEMDYQVGFKNLKPLVIIIGNDTNRYWFGNDTLRYSSCPVPKSFVGKRFYPKKAKSKSRDYFVFDDGGGSTIIFSDSDALKSAVTYPTANNTYPLLFKMDDSGRFILDTNFSKGINPKPSPTPDTTLPLKYPTHPLVILDGKIIQGGLDSIPKGKLYSFYSMPDSTAVAIHGEMGRLGVFVLRSKEMILK